MPPLPGLLRELNDYYNVISISEKHKVALTKNQRRAMLNKQMNMKKKPNPQTVKR